MKLTIESTDTNFGYFILKQIRKFCTHYISNSNFKELDEQLTKYLNSKVKSEDILRAGIENLILLAGKDTLSVLIDNSVKYLRTDMKVNHLCELINYGNLSIDSYPMFTRAFTYIKINIEDLYKLYINQ